MNNTETSESEKQVVFTAVIARQFDNPAEAMAWLMCRTIEQMKSEDKDLSGFGMLCNLQWREIVKRLDPDKKMKPPEHDLLNVMLKEMMGSMGHPDTDDPSEPTDPPETNRLN